MKWVLLMALSASGSQGGVDLDHVLFDDREACVLAAQGFQKRFEKYVMWEPLKTYCAPIAAPAHPPVQTNEKLMK